MSAWGAFIGRYIVFVLEFGGIAVFSATIYFCVIKLEKTNKNKNYYGYGNE